LRLLVLGPRGPQCISRLKNYRFAQEGPKDLFFLRGLALTSELATYIFKSLRQVHPNAPKISKMENIKYNSIHFKLDFLYDLISSRFSFSRLALYISLKIL